MGNVASAYGRAVEKNPLLVKGVTSVALFGAGDLLAQAIEGKKEVDLARFGRLAAWGAMFAVAAHPYYLFLDKLIPGTAVAATAGKVLFDQAIWTPPINIAFLGATSLMEHGDMEVATANVREKLWPVLKVNWVVWPVLQAINFAFVPAPFRILYINVAVVFWSAYLSFVANKKSGVDVTEEPKIVADKEERA